MRLVAWLCVAAAAAFLAAPLRARAADTDRLSSLRLARMVFVDSHGGRNELVLEAERVFLPAGTDVAQLEIVHVQLQKPEELRGSFEMTCERGELSLDSSDFRAEGNVRGNTGDGRQFFTSSAQYDSERGIVSTNAQVRIVDGVRTLMGQGFRYHVSDGRFVLTGGAQVVQE